MKKERHRAREAALQILYQWEIGQGEVGRAVDTFFTHQWPQGETPPDEVRQFAGDLATDTVSRLPEIDRLIAESAERWRPERMAVIDRLIMRMALCEILRDPSTPPAVVINEALELAHTFSTDEAVKFVNGVLDGVRKKLFDQHEKDT